MQCHSFILKSFLKIDAFHYEIIESQEMKEMKDSHFSTPAKGGKIMTQGKEVAVVKNYKDTVFRMLYRGKKELLILYNA